MCHGSLAEVSEVVELMAQVFYLRPAFWTSPSVWMLRILCSCRVEVTVGFLCTGDDGDDRVNVCLEFLVGVGLEKITRSFDSLVGVGVVEGVAHNAIHLEHLGWIFQMFCRIGEIGVASFRLTFTERQWNSDISAGFQSLSPEGTWSDLYTCERNRCDGVARLIALGKCALDKKCRKRHQQ